MNSHPDHPSGPAVGVELSQLDLRYEGCRLQSPAAEARLLAAIAQVGIQQPLQGVELPGAGILLDGFKRLRCAQKLHLSTVPFVSLAPEEAAGIVFACCVPPTTTRSRCWNRLGSSMNSKPVVG